MDVECKVESKNQELRIMKPLTGGQVFDCEGVAEAIKPLCYRLINCACNKYFNILDALTKAQRISLNLNFSTRRRYIEFAFPTSL